MSIREGPRFPVRSRSSSHPSSAAADDFFSLSLSFFFTFFSLFLLVLFSFSAPSFAIRSLLAINSLSTCRTAFFRIAIRRFFPVLLLMPLGSSFFWKDPDNFFDSLILIVVTRQGNSEPGLQKCQALYTRWRHLNHIPILISIQQISPPPS